MQLINFAASKKRRAMNNLLLKHIQILVGLMLLTGDDFVAAAEIAEFMAKRDMHVQREGTLRIAGYRRIKFSGAKFWRKLQRGGIRSITRPGIVIFLDQGQIPVD